MRGTPAAAKLNLSWHHRTATLRPMSARLPPCPHLPAAPAQMDAGALTAHGESRGGAFFLTALTSGQYQWQRGLAARAILCLDRAFSADLCGDESALRDWPMPYAAMGWFLQHVPADAFVGNPRLHFQHLADRMNEPRRDQRRWRAWACWALARGVRPELLADLKHAVTEPTLIEINLSLSAHGLPGEAELWLAALGKVGT